MSEPLDPVDEMKEVLRETLLANDLTLWSASGAHVFNSETALNGLARGLLARKVAEPSRTLDAAREGQGLDVEGLRIVVAIAQGRVDALHAGHRDVGIIEQLAADLARIGAALAQQTGKDAALEDRT